MAAEREREQLAALPAALVAAGWGQQDAGVAGAFAGSGLNPEQYTASRLAGQEYGNRENIVSRALQGDLSGAGAYSMGLAKGPLEMTSIEGNTAFNPYLQAGQQTYATDIGRSEIAKNQAQAQADMIRAYKTGSGSGGESGGGKPPSGYRWGPDGESLIPIPGGPADKAQGGGGNVSEGERKAATLLRRMEGSQSQLQAALKADPKSATPSILAALVGATPFIGDAQRNIVNSSERQRVEAAQLDILDAALTLGTGAAYTKEQLEGYRRSYFPQIGDSADTVKDKGARLENVIESAYTAAGRAAPVRSAQPSGGVDDLLSKYGAR